MSDDPFTRGWSTPGDEALVACGRSGTLARRLRRTLRPDLVTCPGCLARLAEEPALGEDA